MAATLDDIRRITAELPGAQERATTGGAAWVVRSKPFAWEVHPWPSIPADIRAIVGSEVVVAVKVAEPEDALALVEMEPDVFLRATAWSEPKVALRMARVDREHLAELVTEAWRVQAPKYLVREVEASGIMERLVGANPLRGEDARPTENVELGWRVEVAHGVDDGVSDFSALRAEP